MKYRLIMIKGSRGVGKTTMMLQRCKDNGEQGVYASLDRFFSMIQVSQVQLAKLEYSYILVYAVDISIAANASRGKSPHFSYHK